jgi:alpha-L-fucosidase
MTQNLEDRLAWYREAKFGLFLHWGAYSVGGIEASWPIMAPKLSEAMFGTQAKVSEQDYVKFPSRFNPVDFNPDEWVRLAKEAGMRYIIFTSKHHDGFCMFDAPGTDYKITNTAYGKDICLELSQACARAGMPLGFYYSPPDMHHPGYRDTSKPATQNWTGEPKRKEWGEYLDYMESHIRKLLTDYGEVAVLWFDGLTNHGKYDHERFHKLVHELSPKTLINDRLGDDYDYITPEQFIPKKGIPARSGKPNPSLDPGGDGFFRLASAASTMPLIGSWLRNQVKKYGEGTLELTPVHQEPYPSPQRFQPWETCMTMGQSWAYNPDETKWKSPRELIHNLVNVVGRGGNYLLNIGPTARGTFPPEAIANLNAIGQWMKKNSESIYGATYTPLNGQTWGQATRKDDKIYLHVFDWPTDGKLTVESFPASARTVGLLASNPLTFSQRGQTLEIALPAQGPDADDSVIVVEIDPAEKIWSDYSAPVETRIEPKKYIKDQAVASFIINAVLNGLIAFCSYLAYTSFTYKQVTDDIVVTAFIITFLTSWIMVGSARGEYRKGNITKHPTSRRGLKLPASPLVRGLLIGLLCTLIWGAGILSGLVHVISPDGMSNWAYMIVKTIYTGLSGALASAVTVMSVVSDENRR